MIPSEEQSKIVNHAIQGHNIIVDAVAGSGKTTTVLMIASSIPDRTILQLTYNRSLCDEVTKKASAYHNLDVKTYHSLAGSVYPLQGQRGIIKDDTLIKVTRSDAELKHNAKSYSLVIIDECQDMTNVYYDFVNKYLKAINYPQLILMGDRRQCIYEYNCANSGYLTDPEHYWPSDKWRPFIKLPLNTSYRLTPRVTNFVNECLLHEKLIVSANDRNPDSHIDYFNLKLRMGKSCLINVKVFEQVKALLATGNYCYEDFFILAPSVRSQRLMAIMSELANLLSSEGIPIYKKDDDHSSDEKARRDKVCLSTYHSAKGMEKKIVIIIGFDNSYFTFYAKGQNPRECPSTLYVAVTRCSEKLILMCEDESLCFLENIEDNCQVHGDIKYGGIPYKLELSKLAVTDICRHLPSSIIFYLESRIESMFHMVKFKNHVVIKSPSTIKINGRWEEVSAITGIAVVMHYQYIKQGNEFCEEILKIAKMAKFKGDKNFVLERASDDLSRCETKNMEYFLKLANIFYSLNNSMIYNLEQIKEYNWIGDVEFEEARVNFPSVITGEEVFEKGIGLIRPHSKILGAIDMMDDKNVFEFKFTESLTVEHKIQLLLYAWIMNENKKIKIATGSSSDSEAEDKGYFLCNLKTGEVFCLNYDDKVANAVCDSLCRYKIGNLKASEFSREVENMVL